MATEKQANAQKSTGPRTEEGKAKSAMNGFQSRFTAPTEIMTDDERVAKNEFITAYIKDLYPLDAVELR